jgi:hypothetical protein
VALDLTCRRLGIGVVPGRIGVILILD